MNCANHEESTAVVFCRECGKPMCTDCQRLAMGSVFCAEHAPVIVASAAPQLQAPEPPKFTASPYTSAAPVRECDANAHPVLALILGFIPGVGALYNGQYAKGLIHAVVFGLLVSLASSSRGPEPLMGIMIAAWVFYMAFEAFHTARNRRHGDAVEEFSSFLDIKPAQGRFPAGAILLIVLGFILLLDTTDLIDSYQLQRFWPVGLIVFGLYMLFTRVAGDRSARNGAGDTGAPR